jgi:hypothetical protein
MAQWRANYPAARWRDVLQIGVDDEALGERLRSATMTGRPFGSDEFTEGLELDAKRRLRPARAGRPKKPARDKEIQAVLELQEIGE